MKSDEFLLAYCTFPNESVAKELCTRLINERLIACANILPGMKSLYVWNEKLTEDQECAAILKTSRFKQEALKEKFQELHPYEIPALVFLPISDGLPAFLNWISSQCV